MNKGSYCQYKLLTIKSEYCYYKNDLFIVLFHIDSQFPEPYIEHKKKEPL